jgi:hypothetical protein
MAKSKRATTKKAKQSTQLPLDDMRWRPIAEIIEQLIPHIGNKILIAYDLTEALASEKIRCMRRHTNEHELNLDKLSDAQLEAIASGKFADEMGHHQPAGHRDLLPASFWTEHCLACSSNGDIRLELRPPSNHPEPSGASFTFTANWVFYLWEPDCVKAWPALEPQAVAAREAEASEPLGRKPGPRPKKDWKLFIAHELYRLQQAGKPTPTAGDLAELCQHELGYEPDESAISLWLRELGRQSG